MQETFRIRTFVNSFTESNIYNILDGNIAHKTNLFELLQPSGGQPSTGIQLSSEDTVMVPSHTREIIPKVSVYTCL